MIWIDVTDLSSWSGHMTGIQRVVYNIAFRYSRDEASKVGFFRYDASRRQFFATTIDFSVWAGNLQPVASGLSLKDKLVGLVPAAVRHRTPQIAKRAARKAFRVAQSQKHNLNRLKPKPSSSGLIPHVFTAKDTVLVLGNAWDNKYMFLDLGKKKAKEGFELVNVVYDLIPLVEPQFFGGMLTAQYAEYMFESAANSDLVLPISVNTEKDLAKFCKQTGLDMPESAVIRLGDELGEAVESVVPGWYRGAPFILCVGTIEVRKNHMLLYYAYKHLLETIDHKDVPELVIVGSKGWFTGDVVMLFEKDPEVSKKVRLLHQTDDAELQWLYENCLLTIYASMYEGWGLPVAESLARGKIILSSNSSSMAEISQQYVDYFSPYDPVQCAGLIKYYLSTKRRHERESEISKYRTTTWESTYNQTSKLVSKLRDQRGRR